MVLPQNFLFTHVAYICYSYPYPLYNTESITKQGAESAKLELGGGGES